MKAKQPKLIAVGLMASSSLWMASTGAAQANNGVEELLRINGVESSIGFASQISNAGDLDGDGTPDILVSAVDAKINGVPMGEAYAFSGANQQLIHRFSAPGAAGFGAIVTGGKDVDGDAVPDIFISSPFESDGGFTYSGAAFLYSGATGNLIYQFNGFANSEFSARSIAIVEDTNADDYADLLVGSPFAIAPGGLQTGAAYLYSGADGSLLTTYYGDHATQQFGLSVDGAGDVNGDGYGDIIIGSPFWSFSFSDRGKAEVFSGYDGSVLIEKMGIGSHRECGLVVSGVGDMDGDGLPDVAIRSQNPFDSERGEVAVESINGQLHRIFAPTTLNFFGLDLSAAGDVNQDGFDDLLVGAQDSLNNTGGAAYIYLGGSGSLLHRLDGQQPQGFFGASVASAGDHDGDGVPEVMVSAPWESSGVYLGGCVRLFSFHSYMTVASNAVSSSGGGVLGFQLSFPKAAGDQYYKILFSASAPGTFHYGVDIPLSMDRFVLNSYQGNYPFASSYDLQGRLNAFGDGAATSGPRNSIQAPSHRMVIFICTDG
jgi:hypothetical protein